MKTTQATTIGTYIALLRGINVGGNNRVEMAKLRALFTVLGYEKVVTYINSGNVVFDAQKTEQATLAATLEKEIKKTFGFEIPVVVRDKKNILNLVKSIPIAWKNDVEQKTDILFLWDEYDDISSLKLLSVTEGVDSLIYAPGAIVWNVNRKKYTKSGMHKFIGTQLYKHMTARNVNTVRKLGRLMEEG